MAMARAYSRVTHRPAALVYRDDGELSLFVVGPDLGVFVGLRLPRRIADDLGRKVSTTEAVAEQSNPPED